MKRNIFTAIPFLALGGLLLTGCFDGAPVASASDENRVQAENSDQNELATSAAVGDRWYRVSLKTRLRGYNYAQLAYYNNGWVFSRCMDIRSKNVWIDSRFNVPSEVGLIVHGFISVKCTKNNGDRETKVGNPPNQATRTWFVNAL